MTEFLHGSSLAAAFRSFAEKECRGRSPLYQVLAGAVATDREMLRLADLARPGQPRPNMLFAAVHALLLRGDSVSDLACYYPDIAARPRPPRQAFDSFRAFCLDRRDDLAAILEARVVSTNEVARCGALRLAYLAAAQRLGAFHLVEIGASAGLNLFWDRYGYDYGDGRVVGAVDPGLVLACALRGPRRPSANLTASPPLSRSGIDPVPLDARDRADRAWLRALLWPEQQARAKRLALALEIVAADPPSLVAGRANDCLPALVESLPDGDRLCVSHAFTLNQFSPEDRSAFDALLNDLSRRRPLARVGLEWVEARAPELRLRVYDGGKSTEQRLALCDAHGAWLEWLAD